MIIVSIDIYKNKVVRLYKGNIENITEFGYYYEYLDYYYSINLKKIHIVILDNIFFNIKKKIKINNKIKSQIGGGIYSCNIIKFYINNNFKKFVLGSIIFNNKYEFKKILSIYKKKILISLDCINKIIVVNGWLNETGEIFDKYFIYLLDIGIKEIIYTNVNKDGTLSGIKNYEIKFLIKKKNLCKFVISGGVNNFENIYPIIKENKFSFIIGLSIYKFIIKIKNLC
ncbi:HisA/HisF-related TIM barrel protein [Candidatus Carsonella ruddii]|uniref:HisA/HisF-related TIM barrel protein n=1 Tax=Carsonella ruddii TaxID=114186 RepID=UPI003D5C323C